MLASLNQDGPRAITSYESLAQDIQTLRPAGMFQQHTSTNDISENRPINPAVPCTFNTGNQAANESKLS